jgi:hypothetical protein
MKQGLRKPSNPTTRGFTIGRVRFAKISAVENIRLTPAMDADFREFDRQVLSPEERRRVIAEKYGKVRQPRRGTTQFLQDARANLSEREESKG